MPHLHIGFLSSIDPITTRPMRLSDYERAGTDDAWHPGTGFPVKDELLRPHPQELPGPMLKHLRVHADGRMMIAATDRKIAATSIGGSMGSTASSGFWSKQSLVGAALVNSVLAGACGGGGPPGDSPGTAGTGTGIGGSAGGGTGTGGTTPAIGRRLHLRAVPRRAAGCISPRSATTSTTAAAARNRSSAAARRAQHLRAARDLDDRPQRRVVALRRRAGDLGQRLQRRLRRRFAGAP